MKIYDKLQCFEEEWNKKYGYDFDVCYWRKCWNVRGLIFDCLEDGEDNLGALIKREDIPKIIDALKSLNDENWEDKGSSIWTWEEQKPHIERYIQNLKYLYELMGEHDLDVYFYDSY